MLQLKIAVPLACLRLPFRQALPLAARLGATGVEIDARGELRPQDMTSSALRQVRKLLDDHRLQVAAVAFHTRRGYNVRQDLEARVEATKAAMQFAHDLGARVVVNQIGRVPGEPQGPDWELLVEVLRDLGLYSQRAGAWLAAETGSESGPDLARLVAALPNGALGVTLDPGNLMVNGFSPLEAASALGPAIMHVHARDGVRDLAQGRGVEVALGRGACDFPALLGALEEHDYRGWLSVERTAGDDPVFEIGQGIKYLKSL
jgi:sugar phosphate isomerase/epimerase